MSCGDKPCDPSRRLVTIGAAATAASWVMTACGPKRLYEAPKASFPVQTATTRRIFRRIPYAEASWTRMTTSC